VRPKAHGGAPDRSWGTAPAQGKGAVLMKKLGEQDEAILFVLVEDDPGIRFAWTEVCREEGKTLRIFESAAEFLAVAEELQNAKTPIQFYFDQNLSGEKTTGADLAALVHEWPNRRATTIVTSCPVETFSKALEKRIIDRVTGKFPKEVFGKEEELIL
jgi:response regulator RpfG family c-di-GMP phosphodiesterase